MREILFKGKLLSGKGWTFGNLHVDKTGCAIITPDETPIGRYGAVNPDTVCQYTGLTDKNGVKIFETDRVCYQSENHTVYGIVTFGEIPNNDGKTKHIGYYVEWENDGANMWNDWWRCDIAYWVTEEKCVVIDSTIKDILRKEMGK